jgi:uncharacterized metal-binding protein
VITYEILFVTTSHAPTVANPKGHIYLSSLPSLTEINPNKYYKEIKGKVLKGEKREAMNSF